MTSVATPSVPLPTPAASESPAPLLNMQWLAHASRIAEKAAQRLGQIVNEAQGTYDPARVASFLLLTVDNIGGLVSQRQLRKADRRSVAERALQLWMGPDVAARMLPVVIPFVDALVDTAKGCGLELPPPPPRKGTRHYLPIQQSTQGVNVTELPQQLLQDFLRHTTSVGSSMPPEGASAAADATRAQHPGTQSISLLKHFVMFAIQRVAAHQGLRGIDKKNLVLEATRLWIMSMTGVDPERVDELLTFVNHMIDLIVDTVHGRVKFKVCKRGGGGDSIRRRPHLQGCVCM